MRFPFLSLIVVTTQLPTQAWTQLPDFPGIARDDAASFTIADFIYVGTGMDAGFGLTNDWYAFNTATQTWTTVAPLPGSGRQYCVTFVIDGIGYLHGGITATGTTAELWSYDPATGAWSMPLSTNAPALYAAAGYAIGGTGYVASGFDADGQLNELQYVYDPASGEWTTTWGTIPGAPVHRSAAFVHDGFGYTAGGADISFAAQQSVWRLDPQVPWWDERTPLPEPRYAGDAVGVPDGGVFIGGASDGSTLHADVWHFKASENVWSSLPEFGGGLRRGGVIAFAPPGRIYYGTGSDNVVRYADWWMLDLPTGVPGTEDESWCSLSPVPAQEVLNIQVHTLNGPFEGKVLDASGRVLARYGLRIGQNRLDTEHLKNGTYTLVLQAADGRQATRFQVIH